MLTCDNHPTREAINCSRWALKRYLCPECIAAIKSAPSPRQAARDGRREWWLENEPLYGWNNENHAYLNSNAEVMRRKNYHDSGRNE